MATLDVFYAVGQNTSDHKSSSPTLTMTDGLATFSVAQSATNMGVGDRVTYDTSKIAYIASKVSNTQWNLVTALGAEPSDEGSAVTVNSIAHEYTSLPAAESGASDANHINDSDLTNADVILNLPCYNDSGPSTAKTTVTGWTTGSGNYIKIYAPNNTTTECNQSQRWEGFYDTSKYYHATSTGWIDVREDFVIMEGIQARLTTDSDVTCYAINSGSATSEVKVITCLARGPNGTVRHRGFYAYNPTAAGAKVYFINCVAYDWGTNSNAAACAVISVSVGITAYFYNCVGTSSEYGFQGNGAGVTVYCKNCFGTDVVGGVDAFAAVSSATFHADSTNNASNDATAPGSDSVSLSSRTHTNYFVEADNFTISRNGTYSSEIIGAGTDLSSDSDYAFDYDFLGETRPAGSWDIGAHQLPENPFDVYYSIGQNSTDHKTGSPTMTMSDGLATFSVGQTDSAMGVGDRVTYAVSKVAYVASKVSSTQWNLVTARGRTPDDEVDSVSVASIAHEYTSASLAEAGFIDSDHLDETDFDVIDVIVKLPSYYDSGVDNSPTVFWLGYTTYSNNYIHWYTPISELTECNTRQRHNGTLDASKYYTRSLASGSINEQRTAYMKYEGIAFRTTNTSGNSIMINFNNLMPLGEAEFCCCIWHSNDNDSQLVRAIYVQTNVADGCVFKCYNCIVYDMGNNTNSDGFIMYDTGCTYYVYNCTFSNGTRATRGNGTDNFYLKNCVDMRTGTWSFVTTAAYHDDSTNNATDNASGNQGANQITLSSNTITDYFVADGDFHINPSATYASELIEAAADLSADATIPFQFDAEGKKRPNGRWDVGALQYTRRRINVVNSSI